jgi:hypothetical protein
MASQPYILKRMDGAISLNDFSLISAFLSGVVCEQSESRSLDGVKFKIKN